MNYCKNCKRNYDGSCPYDDGDYAVWPPQASGQECEYFIELTDEDKR
jgi:hypothetical protein